ncbi:MAG: hypothetical protein FJ145_23250 [Deltaproteobacteria bacterium]|nr:hypothetical protein [Deltaproteobacteria bacterium]
MFRYGKWIVLLALLASAPAHAQNARTSYGGTSGFNVPIWVGQEAGFFKKHGVNSELVLISGDAAAFQVMLAGDLQFANAAGTAAIQANVQGADFVIIASSYNFMPYSFVVRPEIRAASDLKGKVMSVARLGGINEYAAYFTFEKLGLGPKDMTFVQSGPDGQRIAALQSGAVAATVLAPPGLYAATSLGLKVLADLGELGIKYPTGTIVTRKSFLASNRALAKRYLMGFIEGLNLYARDKDYTLKVMQKYARLRDKDAMAKSHDYFVKNTSVVPMTDVAAIKNALVDKAAGRNPEEFYDNSLIQELVKEGFVDKLPK